MEENNFVDITNRIINMILYNYSIEKIHYRLIERLKNPISEEMFFLCYNAALILKSDLPENNNE